MQAPTRTDLTEWAMLDANVLVYASNKTSPHYQAALHIRDQGQQGKIALCVTPQVLNEYFAVITRPSKVPNPVSPAKAYAEVLKFYASTAISKIYPTLGVGARLETLLAECPVTGLDIYDLYLAATMLESGVKKIYTYDSSIFSRISEVQALTPELPSAED